jgi:TRAP-type mannitol/chloroaromatic compound transport system permease small subunit
MSLHTMMRSLPKFVDGLSEWVGKASAWLIPLLIAELVYDTVARYLFNAPTAWSYDISYMLYGAAFMGGAAYTLLLDEHVRIDVVYEKVSQTSRAFIDAFGYVVFFFPSMGALLYFGTEFTIKSWKLWEASGESMWSPPIYPFKTIIPITALLLIFQGIIQFSRCLISIWKGGKRPDHKP